MSDADTGAFEWVVERGKIAEFARACTDTSEAFHGPDAIAPPTFPTVATHLWEPPGARASLDPPFDDRRVLHGEQSYTYARPLRSGDVLTGRTTVADHFTKSGRRGGDMRFAIFETRFDDPDGEPVCTARATVIETAPTPDTRRMTAPPPDVMPAAPDEPHLILPAVDRAMFVRYAGASGDFNPIHWDEAYARSAGYPSVFGMGMFTAGVLGRFLCAWRGATSIRMLSVRFTGLLWPGENLLCIGSETDRYDLDGVALTDLALSVQNGRGESKVVGSATCTLP